MKWRLIIKKYIPEIQYIPGKKIIAEDALSWLPNNRNQNTTHESTYWMETISKCYDTVELPEGMFPNIFRIKYQYQ